jgi:hypothetical protein
MMSSFVLLVRCCRRHDGLRRRDAAAPLVVLLPAGAVLANALFIAATMAIMIEGLICAVVIVPLFCMFGAIGGLIMGVVCRTTRWRGARSTHRRAAVLLGGIEQELPVPVRERSIEHTRFVDAAPARIWSEIENRWTSRRRGRKRVGLPDRRAGPKAGRTERTAKGSFATSRWEAASISTSRGRLAARASRALVESVHDRLVSARHDG